MTPPRALIVMITALWLLRGAFIDAAIEQNPHGLLTKELFGCSIETRPVSFGSYDPLGGQPRFAQGSVIYTCGLKLAFPVRNIRVELTQGRAGTFNRAMFSTDRPDQLNYNLYLNSNYNQVWGDGSAGTDYYFDASPPFNWPVTVTVYGRILGRQDVSVGNYSDSLQARIEF